jgi:hypothetical protein
MAKEPPKPEKPVEIEPDAWERFERAVDVVIKTKPKHRPTKRKISTPKGKRSP